MNITWRKLFISGALFVVAVHVLFGRFTYSSVCQDCGAGQTTTEWQILFTEFTLFHHSSFRETPFSIAATRYGRTKDQPHHWAFAAGSGNFIGCAIGSGRYLWRSTGDENVLRLLHLAFASDREFAEQVYAASLSPACAAAIVALAATLPSDAKTPAALRVWRERHTFEINEVFARYKPTNAKPGPRELGRARNAFTQ